jgi:hypothetical protein
MAAGVGLTAGAAEAVGAAAVESRAAAVDGMATEIVAAAGLRHRAVRE